MKFYTYIGLIVISLTACNKGNDRLHEDPTNLVEIGNIDLGDETAAEISAYDVNTKRLFVVNNDKGTPTVDVVSISDPSTPELISQIQLSTYASAVNSVDVFNGILAIAVAAPNPQDNGYVLIVNTETLSIDYELEVGALPDMVCFTKNGKYILSANEGEPNQDYTNDPEGTVSIIDVANYAVSTIGFSDFAAQQANLEEKGLKINGPNSSFEQDIEPEYITVSSDSKYAWVSLQENNGIAKINIETKTIVDIFPLGYKDYSKPGNEIDVSDDDKINPQSWNVKGLYQPDGIAYFSVDGQDYILSANEGDSREYAGFTEEVRVSSVKLDSTVFPNYKDLQIGYNLGRLVVIRTLGDTDNDTYYEELYSYGARSFSIWNANSGEIVFDCGNEIEEYVMQHTSNYSDGRSDNKGVEPEGVEIVEYENSLIAYITLERANLVMIYDITNPQAPVLLGHAESGVAPEGILHISPENSPSGRSLIVICSEFSGGVKILSPAELLLE